MSVTPAYISSFGLISVRLYQWAEKKKKQTTTDPFI